jgi:UDP-glucose:(heptosyl)LPS alpha-1,3-glucosyltransferase
MSKKIALLKSGAGQKGGLEKYTFRLVQAFQEKGCNVTLFTSGKPDFPCAHATLDRVSKFSFRKVLEFDRFCSEKIQELRPDVIFGMDRNRFQTHLRAGNGVHASYLEKRKKTEGSLKGVSFAINPLHKILLKLEKEAFEHPELERLFVNSTMVKNEILHCYATDPKKISVVHNGVEWQEFQPAFDHWPEGKNLIARELNLDPSLFHFVFIGHNYKRKGLEPLLRGAALLAHRKFHLSIVGKEKDLSYFTRLVRRLNLESKVSFFGPTPDVSRFYQLADALVIPSLYDPFANVTLEALAFGVFVISSRHNGAHEILTPETGTTIESLFDPYSVAAAMQQTLERPKTSEGAANIRASVKHLDFSHQLQKLIEPCIS